MKKKVLITGVAGFIGSNLADRLLREGTYHVIGIDNLSAGVIEQIPCDVEFHRADIRSKEIYPFFDQVDCVFHLAAKNCINDCQKDPIETADVNVTGTVNVFEAAVRSQVRKVIYAESSALYEGSSLLPTPEYDLAPESFYAVSKLATLHFAEAYRRYRNLNCTALRYFCVYGPRQDYRRTIPPVMSAFILHLLRGARPQIYGSGLKRRDFIYVDDVNDFHLLCMNDERTDGKTFNLGSGITTSVNELYALVSQLLQVDVVPIYQPDLPGEAECTLANIDEAIKIGWRPKTTLHDGLQQAIRYIRTHVL
jgi:UDP-glucose 4-epimerase